MRPLNISGSQAKDYYYGKDPIFDTQDNSAWHGELAKQFGLAGRCKEPDFINAISGNDPKGNQIIQDGVNKEHRAAIDIPLSAPKSVSVLALHVGDEKLIEAHHKAVASTIGYIENNYLYSRKTQAGHTTAFKTGNGLFATFVHSTSRANDPHLHTHTLTLNMTRTDAGLRAIFNDPIFKDQTLLNYVYQSELAKNVRQLGYGIANETKGKWEIAGFKNEWIKSFSTRTGEIEDALDQLKSDSKNSKKPDGKLHDQAQKSSRDKKDHTLTRQELQDRWQGKVDREKIRKAVEAAKHMEPKTEDKQFSARDYIRIAYNAIHENESTFTRQDVVKVALELSRGHYTVADIEQSFYEAVKAKEIEYLRTHTNKKGVETVIFTSRDMRRTEEGIVRTFDKENGQIAPAVRPEAARAVLNDEYSYFTDGQKQVVEKVLCTDNRFVIVQGDAGTGKTSALEAIKYIADRTGADGMKIEISGLGYTGKASREIVEKAGIESQTLHRFLSKKAAAPSESRRIWIVDESSMVGSRQMEAVMARAVEQDASVVFVGDGKQLQAISAGRMFKELQARGHVEVVKMEEALRQKTDYMKAAVFQVKQFQNGQTAGGIDAAFTVLESQGRVREVPARAERMEQAARHFIDHADKQNCLIVTPVNKDRVAINEIVHTALKPKDQKELTALIHTPEYQHGTDRYFARSYKPGQKAFIDQSNVAGLASGQEVTIAGVDVDANKLMLSSGVKTHCIDLKKGDAAISVYNVEQRSFFEGEKVVFLKNDAKLDLVNGQTATITKIGPEQVITARMDNHDREVKINLAFYPYIDRGYAVTIHKSQGQTAKEVVMVTDSKQPLNKTETFYVALSRAQDNFTLYTDKADEVKSQFKEAQPKTSTLELVDNLLKDNQALGSHSIER